MAFIEVQNVRFSYDTESVDSREVLHGINLSIEAGEFVALLGHNGCGKSTMAKLFNGMLLPTSGSVLVDGIDTQDEARQFEVRSRVGLVQQNPDNQLVAGVVEEDVAFGPENLGVPPLEIRKRVDEALKAVEMCIRDSKMGNSLLAVRDINHKYIVVGGFLLHSSEKPHRRKRRTQ